MTKTKVVIPCGGNGVRLRPLSFYIQKCMVPLPPSEKPLLEYITCLARSHGLREFIFLVGYKAEQIINYFGDGGRFGVNITYVKDPPGMKGSGWALYNSYLQRQLSEAHTMLVYYGDILSDVNLSELLYYHREKEAVATLVTSKGYHLPVGMVQMENERVTSVIEKPSLQIQVGTGIMVIEGSTLDKLEHLCRRKDSVDLMADFIPALLSRGLNIAAYQTNAFWYDIGSLDKYEKLRELKIPNLQTMPIDNVIMA